MTTTHPPLDYTRPYRTTPGATVWITRPPADAAIQQVYRYLLAAALRAEEASHE